MKSPSYIVYRRVCMAICSALILGGIALGLYARATQTDYGGAQRDEMERMPYRAYPVSSQSWSVDLEGMDLENRIDQTKDADVIIRASLAGDKDIGYGAFVSPLTVLEVYRGDSIHVGDSVTLIEPYKVNRLSEDEIKVVRNESLDDYNGLLEMCGLSDGDDVHVLQPIGEPYLSGALPIAESGEYLLFLDYADAHLARGSDIAACTFVPTPFSCVSMRGEDGSAIWASSRYATKDELDGLAFLAVDAETLDGYLQIASDLRAYAEGQPH